MDLAELSVRLERRFSSPSAPKRLVAQVGDELVTFSAREARLQAQCTCGAAQCEHFARALLWLAESDGLVSPTEVAVHSSLRPKLNEADLASFADALDALLLAVLRAGTDSHGSPTVRDAVEQVVACADKPTPLGLARWLGRLQEALGRGDSGKIARVLEGARRLTDEIRAADTSREAMRRRAAWLGPAATGGRGGEPIEDAVLIEVAREWMGGGPRERIERRYLLDLARGDVLREDRARAVMDVSVGPCPRIVQVAFGEVEPFGEPKRVRLLQYAVSPRPTAQHWAAVERFAARLVRQLGATYASAMSACPAIAEPFVLFAPQRLSNARAELVDGDGERLPLLAEAERTLFETLKDVTEGGQLVWVAGRLIGIAGGLFLRPVSALVRIGEEPRHFRLA